MGGHLSEAVVGLEPKFQVQQHLSAAKLLSLSQGKAQKGRELLTHPALKPFFAVPVAQVNFQLSFHPSLLEDGEQLLGKRC